MPIERIAPSIYSVDHDRAEGKNAIILSQRGAIAIDLGDNNAVGDEMAAFIRDQGYQPDRVILTHGHDDHVLGGAAFAGAEVYAHEKTPAVARRILPGTARRRGISDEEIYAQALWPTVMFSDELYLDLGDMHVRLFPTPGHSVDGVSVYVEEDRLLVAGDAVVTGIIPAIGDGDSRVLERTLNKLLTWDIDIMIPGHGAVIHGAAAVQEALQWAKNYLSGVRAAVATAIDSGVRDPEAIADTISYEQYVGDRLPVDRHGMPRRHRNTVLKIISEIESHVVK